jgi:N-acetyl-anhydromuramyl-L-alanine amidase AmpD
MKRSPTHKFGWDHFLNAFGIAAHSDLTIHESLTALQKSSIESFEHFGATVKHSFIHEPND